MTCATLPLVALALGLGGCVAVPCAGNPSATCYAPVQQQGAVAYPGPGAYPAGAAPPDAYGGVPGQPVVGPDGLPYVDGYPVFVEGGVPYPVFFDATFGGWGYYDGFHRWHGAPGPYRDRLDRFHPGGRGLPPPGAFRGFRGGPATGGPVGGLRGGAPYGFRGGPGFAPGPGRGPAPAALAPRPAVPGRPAPAPAPPAQRAPPPRCPPGQVCR